MSIVTQKVGDSFIANCAYTDKVTGLPIPLTGVTIKSQVRSKADVVMAELSVTVTNSAGGLFTLSAADTSTWPVGTLYWDIRYTSGGIIIHTDTIEINTVGSITR